MIPFEEIDSRLSLLKKDRAWLAENTPYSADYIRTVLAPKSTRRTVRVQTVLSDAIEAEERKQQTPAVNVAPDTITLIPSEDQYRRWSEAQKDSPFPTLKDWAVDELNRAAAQWAREKATQALRVAEDPMPYGNQGNGS